MIGDIKSKNFVGKLEYLLQNPAYQRIITWSDNSTVIEVLDSAKMQKEILPFYFRHQKFESFVRQLNLYGFKKLKSNQKQRFTHHLLHAGSKLSEITSCKSNKSKLSPNTDKNQNSTEKNSSENGSFQRASQLKLVGSAFTIYNPLSQNRNGIFVSQNIARTSPNLSWNEQPSKGNIVILPGNQYLMWNWMESFKSSYVGNILLSEKQPLEQHQEAIQL